jgi:hypothetical protein
VAERWGLYGSFDYDWLSLYPRPLRNLTLLFRAAEETPEFARLLRVGSVDFVIALHREGLEDLQPVARVPSRFAGDVFVYRTPSPLPRSYAVSGVRTAQGLPALRMLADPSFDPSTTIVLPEGSPRDASPSFRGASRLADYRPDRVVLEAELSEPGYVVLADAYDPGWRARIDGRPALLLAANAVFRAVPVDAGRHRVELLYRPAAVTRGVAVALGSAVLALGGVVSVRRRERGRKDMAPGTPT